MSKFLTQFNCGERNKKIKTNAGSPVRFGYHYKNYDDGSRQLVLDENDKTDIPALINSYADDVNIVKMYERYLNGDISALDKNQGWYSDITELPKTMSDFLDMFDNQERTFGGLPVKFKQRFNNDYKQYAASIANGSIDKHIKEFYYDYYNDYKFTKNLAQKYAPEVEDKKEVKNTKKSEVKVDEES